MLTSLLEEMSGVQELVGVTIVAATNRPDVIVRLTRMCFQQSVSVLMILDRIPHSCGLDG